MEESYSFTRNDLLKSNVADIERHIIIFALRQTSGNQTAAARQLGTTKRIFKCRIRKYGIDVSQFGSPEKHPE
jgi:transcriptional regulator with GAF, ATPase, and Fis domain